MCAFSTTNQLLVVNITSIVGDGTKCYCGGSGASTITNDRFLLIITENIS